MYHPLSYCVCARVLAIAGIEETSEDGGRGVSAARSRQQEGRVREVEESAEAKFCHFQAFGVCRRRRRGQITGQLNGVLGLSSLRVGNVGTWAEAAAPRHEGQAAVSYDLVSTIVASWQS